MAPAGGQPRVAVVGATGIVGKQIVELIGERGFGIEPALFCSESGGGEAIDFGDSESTADPLSDISDLASFDLAFLAVPASAARDIVRARPGPILIDLSAATRVPSTPPLSAPGLTSREAIIRDKQGLYDVPHPVSVALATIIGALKP